MCKMLFIGTKNELQEIPLDNTNLDLYLKKISGEFLPIKHAFKNQNIYLVGTSRGCSCDLGIQSNNLHSGSIEQTPPTQNLLNKFRNLSGTFIEWKNRHQEKVDHAMGAQGSYLTQSLKLVDLILNETKKGNTVETFCVWAGNYNTTPEFNNTIVTTTIDLGKNFETAKKEFTTYV